MLKAKRAKYALPVRHTYGISRLSVYNNSRTLTRANVIQYYIPLSYNGSICFPSREVRFPYVLRRLRVEKNLMFLSQAERLDFLKITSRIRCGFTRRHKDSRYLIREISAALQPVCAVRDKKRGKRSERSMNQKDIYDQIQTYIATNVREASKLKSIGESTQSILELFKSCLNYKIVNGSAGDNIFSSRMRTIMASMVVKACLDNGMRLVVSLLFRELSNYSDEQLGITKKEDYNTILRSCLVRENSISGSKVFFNTGIVLNFAETRIGGMNDIIHNATLFTKYKTSDIYDLPAVISDHLRSGIRLHPSTINRCILNIVRKIDQSTSLRLDLIKDMMFLIFKMPFHTEHIYIDESKPEPLCIPPGKPVTFDGQRNRKKLMVNNDTFKVLGRAINNSELALLLVERAEYYGFLQYQDVQAELLSMFLRSNISRNRGLHIDFLKRLEISDNPYTPRLASDLIRHLRHDYMFPGLMGYVGNNDMVKHKAEGVSLSSCIYNMCMNYPSGLITVSWWSEILNIFGLPMPRPRIISAIKLLARFEEFYIVYILYLQFLNFLNIAVSKDDRPFVPYNITKNLSLVQLSEKYIIDATNPNLYETLASIFGPGLSPPAVKETKRRFLFEIAMGHSLDSPWTYHAARAFRDDPRAFRYILRGAAKHYNLLSICPEVFKLVVKTGLKFDKEYMKHILVLMRTRHHPTATYSYDPESPFANVAEALGCLIDDHVREKSVPNACAELEHYVSTQINEENSRGSLDRA